MTTSLHPITPGGHEERDEHLLSARARIAELEEALRTNRSIGAAVGIVMERFELDAETALAYLKRLSSHHNLKLRDLAAHLVETRTLPSDLG